MAYEFADAEPLLLVGEGMCEHVRGHDVTLAARKLECFTGELFMLPGEIDVMSSAEVSYRPVLACLDDPDGSSVVLLEQQRDLSLKHGFPQLQCWKTFGADG